MTKLSNIFLLIMFSLLFFITFIILINLFNISTIIILLIIYSLLIFINLSYWSKNYIYSIILFLTLISGLLIIFLYFTSLISNIKNNFYVKPILILTFLINTLFLFFINLSNFTFFSIRKFNLIFLIPISLTQILLSIPTKKYLKISSIYISTPIIILPFFVYYFYY